MTLEATHPGSTFVLLALSTWTTGWHAAQPLMADWLTSCPGWFARISGIRLLALFRKVREQGGLSTLASMLRDVADRSWWKPWSEAVSALDSGAGPEACTSPEAKRIYNDLS